MKTDAQTVRCGTKVAPSLGNELPKAFQLSTSYDVSDEKLIRRIKFNPILQICSRLAVCRVNRDGTVFDPKNFGIFGKQRLFLMIGKRLSKSAYVKLTLLTNRQWNTVEQAWTAIMHSILLHSEFNPTILDRKLRIAITKFKVWFIEMSMKGRIVRKPGSKPRVLLSQWDKVLKGLKTIAGWFQYYALDEPLHNVRPPSVPWFFGWKVDHPTFPWFAGHLEHFRELEGKTLSDLDIRTLCQIRTFGRALPPPSIDACVEDLDKQVKVLTSENPVSDLVLTRVRETSSLLAEKLGIGDMPMLSHISVSTSGCFEMSQRDGGLAAVVRGWVKELDVPINFCRIRMQEHSYGLIDHRMINKSEIYKDVYGNRLFPGQWASDDPLTRNLFSEKPEKLKFALRMSRKTEGRISLLDKLYRQFGHFRKAKATRELLAKDLYPSEICPAILAVASSEAIKQGHYNDLLGNQVDPDMWLVLPSGREIPLFSERGPLRYIPREFPRVQMQCLAEPGAKSRSLGKNQGWFTIVTKIMRFMVEPILARDGRARIGLNSTNKMWSFLKLIQRNKSQGQWLQSTDYSAATDYISLDMLKAMWEPWFKRLRASHPFAIYEELIYCRRSLHFSGKFEKCRTDADHKCGSFMGEPMSFMSLTLINLIIEELACTWQNAEMCFRTPVESLRSFEPLAICGDDVASVRRTLKRIHVFKHIVSCVGMKLSWKDGISRRLLIFCEEHVCVFGKEFTYIDVIKSRLLTTMARQHSDNRSSILGKGRMLGTQLAYFDNRMLKIFIMKIYDQVFNRSHKYIMNSMNLPYFLPPSCGGLGYPIPESQIPDWAYEYIGVIFKILDETNILSRYHKLYELNALTKRNKHGIDATAAALAVFAKMAKTEEIQILDEPIEEFKSRTIYPDTRIREALSRFGITVPNDPYTGGPDRDCLRNEAHRFGIIRLDDLFEQIERTINFDTFFRKEVVREQRTFEQWLRRSGKYWKRVLYKTSPYERMVFREYGKIRFKDLNHLDNQVLRSFGGYVVPMNWGTLDEAGPSLRIDFRIYRAGYGRYPYRDREPIKTEELFRSTPIGVY